MEPFAHTRPDGRRVVLTGPRWRLEVRGAEGHLTEVPQEWLVEHASAARTVALRKLAEPVTFGATLMADVLTAVGTMARHKPGEVEAFNLALAGGRPVTLANLLRGLDGRRVRGARGLVAQATVDTGALVDRVKHAERAAVAALDPALVARLDAWMAGAKAS